ncbi:hypothetical protein D9615_002475 [Tricholomella constricta]|uniref:RNA polymerase II elongation factor ELL N-terminal domain-containing protein n=1 Tax=Tricholomella constricta TaxID=117010 RepID=A0A8H5M9N0_9AGAR|nr:hypothetical protein D9615_002475 [Tricholomella constricta]
MPLPEASLSLGPHTHPGESEHSKPKVAMLVRLSTETLDAIQALGEKPAMDFEFGDAPGIHIGGTFYPMRPLREETPHELYLRTHSSSKPSAPLKLYANVAGKFTIEHDKLGDNLKDKIREKTQDAAKQRDDRRTKFIDTPPVLPTNKTKKRKEPPTSSMFRNAIRPSDQAKLNASASSSAAAARVSSPAPPPPPPRKPADPSLRRRLVHCIAIQERTRDQIVKMVAGADCDASRRREVLDALEDVGEQTSSTKKGENTGSKTWRLKTEAWKEVRPYEWPKLPEQERINLARTGRQKLSSLGIKQTDPLWEHFTFRASTTTASAAPPAGPSRTAAGTLDGEAKKAEIAPKRGVSSKEAKEKPKAKADVKAEILMKDESIKARASNANGKSREVEGGSQAAARPAATGGSRKVPGSGFRIGKSTSSDVHNTTEGSSRPAVSQGKVVDRDAKASRPSLPAKPTAPNLQSSIKEKTGGSTVPPQRIRILRESDAGFGSDYDRERGADRSRDVAKSKVTLKQGGEERRKVDSPMLKRKQMHPDGDDSEVPTSASAPQKKRRTESGAVATSSSSKPKDLLLPMKPELAPPQPRTKIRKDPSPLPQPPPLPKINKKENPAPRPSAAVREGKMSPPESVSSTQSYSRGRSEAKANGATKRRRSPIYTSSSEDEGEIRRRRDAPLRTLPMTTTHHSTVPTSAQPRPRVREPRPLPTDHAGLRARYSATYNEYMAVFAQMVGQKTKIDTMLRNGDSGSTTDSDGDAELMDSEDLARLSVEYKRLHEELETIRSMFPEAQ